MITVSKKVEYSIVFLSFLSRNKDKNISLTEAAKKLRLPYRFLGQLASLLKANGLIESREGKSGGYRLNSGWDKRSLFDLLEALDENKPIVNCLGGRGCIRVDNCSLKKIWEKVEKSWYLELKKVKLSDIN